MYELRRGSIRLISAIQRRPEAINALAQILNYYPEQLCEDIQALSDLWDEHFLNDDEED